MATLCTRHCDHLDFLKGNGKCLITVFGEVQRTIMCVEKNLITRQQYKERVTSNMF